MLSLNKLKKVDTPLRYTGGEARQYIKNVSCVSLRACVISPAMYEIGTFDMEVKALYYILNSRKDTWCERCFAPLQDFEKLLKEENEKLYTLESKTPLKNMDVIIFSVSSEMMYTNILNMLELGGIPIFKDKRKEGFPLVIATGSAVLNPKPLETFVDMFVMGEISIEVNEIFDIIKENKYNTKDEILKSLSELPGMYIPQVTTGNVYMLKELDIDSEVVPINFALPSIKTMIDKPLVMLSKGCDKSCVNCTHKYIYGKPEYLSVDKAVTKTKKIVAATGDTKIILGSNCFGNYPGFPDIIYKLQDLNRPKIKDISLMEVKLNKDNLWVLKYMKDTEPVSIIVGAPTSELREKIGIGINEDDTIFLARKIFEAGFSKIRLKYIIGIPTETYEDLSKILNLANKICKIYKEYFVKAPDKYIVELNIYNFKPKPHTPSQWCAVNSAENFEIKARYLKDKNRNENVCITCEEGKQSVVETILSRGDEKVSDLIYEAYKQGARNDMIEPMFMWDAWQIAINKWGIDVKDYLSEYNDKIVLPWDNICVLTPKEELRRIYINKIKGD